ncbi:glutathione S-transferase C-terminal domain-containing protein [Sorangium sp. So ce136]|uniref:glutathione S-transferase C-terminal domain-containing protein n=1 Tax=Sorangium sp. So ce136 TaxID=3133284 RepID=UPI003F5215D4
MSLSARTDVRVLACSGPFHPTVEGDCDEALFQPSEPRGDHQVDAGRVRRHVRALAHQLREAGAQGELGNGPYLFGDWFTAADVMVGSMFIWMRLWGGPTGRPSLEAYVDRLQARPHGPKLGK